MIKAVFCLLIIFSSTSIGFYYSLKLFNRKKLINNFIVELKKCLTKIRYTSQQLSSIFSDNFMNYNFLPNKPFDSQWEEMLTHYKNILNENDIEILRGFAKNLGTTDTEGELSSINMYIDMLSDSLKNAQSDIDKKSKLYKTLGLSLGVTISILLI